MKAYLIAVFILFNITWAGIVSAGPEQDQANESNTKASQPQPVVMDKPAYPPELRAALKEGKVVLDIIVKSDGTVGDVTIVSSDEEAFSRAAVEAASTWKFKPAEKDGQAVESRIRIPIPFKIQSLVFEPKELTKAPKPISQRAPLYPQDLRRAGIEGVVLLMFVVRPDGTVDNIRVIKSDHQGFNQEAVAAVSKWKFKPGEKNGRPVNARVRVPIPFRIR